MDEPLTNEEVGMHYAALRDQLRQVKKERDRAVNELVAEVGKGHEWDEKYDAAIERAERAEQQLADIRAKIGVSE